MKRLLVCLLIALMAMGLFANGGGDKGEKKTLSSSSAGSMGKYDPSITVKVWRSEGNNRAFPEGQSTVDNIWTRAIEDELGIKFDYMWIAPSNEFQAKVNTSIAAGDLPDIIPKLNLEQYYNLARVGKLAPMSEIFKEYDVNNILKENLDYGNNLMRNMLTIKGELYGFGQTADFEAARMLVFRNDWLNNLGYDMPESWEETLEILYAFSNDDPDGNGKDDTYGLGASAGFLGGGMPLEPLFQVYGSQPQIWVESKGKLVYGSVMPETKEALKAMAKLQADGILSPEWPVLGTWSEAPAEVAQGKVGATFAATWWHNWTGPTESVKNKPGMEWEHMYTLGLGGKPIITPIQANIQAIVAVNADFEYPEAIMKIFNLHYAKADNPETANSDFHTIIDPVTGGKISTFFYYNDFFNTTGIMFKNLLLAKQVTAALESNDPSKLTPEGMLYYTGSKGYMDGTMPLGKSDGPYGNYKTFGPNGSWKVKEFMINGGYFIVDAFQGVPTKAQADFAGDLRSTRDEMFIQMITGMIDVDEGWDKWLGYWESNGGAEWTQQVNEWKQSK